MPALILRHHLELHPQRRRRPQRPSRIGQHRPAHEDESARPFATISAAISGDRIIPTAPVGIPVSARIRSANGT